MLHKGTRRTRGLTRNKRGIQQSLQSNITSRIALILSTASSIKSEGDIATSLASAQTTHIESSCKSLSRGIFLHSNFHDPVLSREEQWKAGKKTGESPNTAYKGPKASGLNRCGSTELDCNASENSCETEADHHDASPGSSFRTWEWKGGTACSALELNWKLGAFIEFNPDPVLGAAETTSDTDTDSEGFTLAAVNAIITQRDCSAST